MMIWKYSVCKIFNKSQKNWILSVKNAMRLGTADKVCVLEGWRVFQNTTIKFGTPRKASENI